MEKKISQLIPWNGSLINTFGKKTSSSQNITYFHKRIPTANVTELVRTVDGKRRATHRKYTLTSRPFQARQINVWLHYILESTVLYWQRHCYQDREKHPLKTKTSYISKSALLQITASTAGTSAGTAMSVTGHTSSQRSQTELCQQKFAI